MLLSHFWLFVDGPSVFRAIWIITSCSIGSGSWHHIIWNEQLSSISGTLALKIRWVLVGVHNTEALKTIGLRHLTFRKPFDITPFSLSFLRFLLAWNKIYWIYEFIKSLWISHYNVVIRAVIGWFAVRYLNFLIILLVFQSLKIIIKQYIEQSDIVIVILQYG